MQESLESPDKVDSKSHLVGGSSRSKELIDQLNIYANIGNAKMFKHEDIVTKTARTKLFTPHEVVDDPDYPGVQFATSVVAVDLFDESNSVDSSERVGDVVFFKLDHSDKELSAKDLTLGENCLYGAILLDGQIQPFKLETKESEDRVVSQLERNDPTEEDGVSVDSRIVQKGNGLTHPDIHMLDHTEEVGEYNGVMDELQLFVDSRQQQKSE